MEATEETTNIYEYLPFIICGSIGFLTLFIYLAFVFTKRGIRHWIRYFKNRLVVHFHYKKFQKKLPSYNQLSDSKISIVDIGVIPSASQYEIENPCHIPTFQHSDGIHFFGVDCEQNSLDVCINKIQDSLACVWIFLKLSNGALYRNPPNQDSRTSYVDSDNLFYSSGLQIRCLSPLRKWRISFNGLLQEYNPEKDESGETAEFVHVKFSFVWLAMCVPKELNVDISHKKIAKAFSDASRDIGTADLQCFYDIFNRYEQWGQLMGTFTVKGREEKELYLWSSRTRILDCPLWKEKDIRTAKLYMYFKEGYPLKIESISVKNFLSNYTSGFSINGIGGIEDITDCDFKLSVLRSNPKNIKISFKKSGKQHSITIEFVKEGDMFFTGPNLEWSTTAISFKVLSDDGDSGFGVLHFNEGLQCDSKGPFEPPPLLLKDMKYPPTDKLISLLTDEDCKSSFVSGGKGCSLALLTSLSKSDSLFEVPKGFVVTTTAFENHIKSNAKINLDIQRLIDVSGGKISGDLKTECSKCVEEFQTLKLSDDLKNEILNTMLDMYESIENVRFSVRSSACGEDSEDLSAAGQMLTVLGVRGINNIVDAVVKCWSSKFGFEAVQYARQNGQPIKSSMAVVIQEMVPSDVAGVMFTVDPVTGDPSYPYITANYGLGETVVSSLVEPDTIILRRENESVTVHEKSIGAKKTQIHMTEGGGTEQKVLDCESLGTCLNDEWCLKIGSTGILIEKCFCGPRDIEWAVHDGKLFLLQARPVTTLHTETEFELIHDQDSPIRSHNEFWTRANTGEVFLGSTSPLGISLVVGCMDIFSHRATVTRENIPITNYCPYFLHMLPVTHKQVTLSVIDILYRANDKEITSSQKGFEVGIFGRVVGTDEMHKAGVKKYGYMSRYRQWFMMVFLFMFSFKVPKMVTNCNKKIREFKLPLETFTDINKTWNGLLALLQDFFNEVNQTHGIATYLSSIYNLVVITSLAKGKKVWDSELYCEFSSVLSACSGVESADVPQSLQELAQAIAKDHKGTFPSLSEKMAYNTLKNDKGSAGKLFKEFLEKHGHRCIQEFDLHSISWAMNPESLMPTIQNLVASPNILNMKQKDEITVDEAISKLKIPISRTTKKVLQLVLPWSREAVRQREKTKSMVIKMVDWVRQTCLHLGKFMVEEGMLPNKELIFFLTLEEVYELFTMRKPGLVPKAMRRSRLKSKLDKLQFPEIIKGIPRPITQEDDHSKYSASFTLQGIPVCQGRVKATARVVISLSEASTIQNGDILITHSTDIGWSPYFPLLSGVVTVLGGLISHGAVVAREYGLPCVVGVQEATYAFKSGDIVLLDGNRGTISRISNSD